MRDDYNATLIGREVVSETLVILTVRPDQPPKSFSAGQFATLGLDAREPRFDGKIIGDGKERLIRKAYSIASGTASPEALEFYIALVPEGELTPRLFALKEGARLFLGPRVAGKFTLEEVPQQKNIFLFATGTGLAPFMSMIRSHLVCHGERKFVVVHGARTVDELGYRQELSLLSSNCPSLFYFPALSRPREGEPWTGFKGRITSLLGSGEIETKTGLTIDPQNSEIFLCGNPAMVEELVAFFHKQGFVEDQGKVRGNLHKEEYW